MEFPSTSGAPAPGFHAFPSPAGAPRGAPPSTPAPVERAALASRISRVRQLHQAARSFRAEYSTLTAERARLMDRRDALLFASGDALAVGREIVDLNAAVSVMDNRVDQARVRMEKEAVSARVGVNSAAQYLQGEVERLAAERLESLHRQRLPLLLAVVQNWYPPLPPETPWLRAVTCGGAPESRLWEERAIPASTRDFTEAHVDAILEAAAELLAVMGEKPVAPFQFPSPASSRAGSGEAPPAVDIGGSASGVVG